MKTYVQQIMLGTVTGSEQQARDTLQRIKAAGYDGLELNAFMVHPSSFTVRLLTRAAGMPTGKGGKFDWHSLTDESGLSNTETSVITGMYRFDYSDRSNVKKLAERLNKAGESLKAEGISLLYHNHNIELLKVDGNTRAYDILIDETDPEFVNFEFDSYWFTDGGADAKLWMKRLGKRIKLWHINDRGSRLSGSAMTPILKEDSMELGTGNMDLEGLRDIALENSVEAVVLESHKNWIDRDPVKSLELSSNWLNGRF